MFVVFEYDNGEMGVVPKEFADYLISEVIEDEDVEAMKRRINLLKTVYETSKEAEKFIIATCKYIVVVNPTNNNAYVIDSQDRKIAYSHCFLYRGFNDKNLAKKKLKSIRF